MKKYLAFVALLAILAMLLVPVGASAASTLYIDITATGSEVTITCNCTAWAVGTVSANDNVSTSLAYCKLDNTTSEAVEVTVHGNEMKDAATGAAETWTLSATGTPGANTIGMRVAVDDSDDHWGTLVKDHDDGTVKLNNDGDETLAAADHWDFGMNFLAPTSSVGNEAMIMCDDAGSQTDDTDNGITLIAAVP